MWLTPGSTIQFGDRGGGGFVDVGYAGEALGRTVMIGRQIRLAAGS
jgi:hypothetical protein